MVKFVYTPCWFLIIILFLQPLNGFLISNYSIFGIMGYLLQIPYLIQLAVIIDWETLRRV
jgi:hypothetical protein